MRSPAAPRARSLLLAAAIGYLAGLFPSADLATRLAGRDAHALRNNGSGNPGATNASAVLGRRWGLMVLIADMSKGALAGGAGRAVGGPAGAYCASTLAIAGHIAPVWAPTRGGKGIATSAGACLTVFPAYFPVDAAVALTSAAATRNAERAVWCSCAAWIGSSLVWWRKDLPNLWGPRPTTALPLFALASSVMIITKFRLARRPA